MPAVPGSTYYVTSYVSSFTTTSAYNTGTDQGGATTTVVTVDNESPANPALVSGAAFASKQITLTYTNATTTDATSTIILRSTNSVTDTPVEGTIYSAGNTIGAATVVCVSTSITLGAQSTCSDTTITRVVNYYYKIFTKDVSGNYSTGIQFGPYFVSSPKSASPTFFEAEVQSAGTTTVSGGGVSGGGGDTGTTTNATTTTSTSSPTQGGGGGDVGFFHLRDFFSSAFALFFTRGQPIALAESVPVNIEQSCAIHLFSVCIARSVSWFR
jgi:hypothetical protein